MALVSSRSFFKRGREDTAVKEGVAVEQHYSKERVERDGRLIYIEGDPIDPDDEETLREQGFLDAPKAKKKTADKARKATKNK